MRSNVLAYLALFSALVSLCLGRWVFHNSGESFAMSIFCLIAGIMTIQSPESQPDD